MLQEIIKNYIEFNNIKNYKLTTKYIKLADWNYQVTLDNEIAFVYNFSYLVTINDDNFISDNTTLVSIESEKLYINYGDLVSVLSEIATFSDYTEIRSMYISVHERFMKIIKASPTWVASELNGHIEYILLTILK